MKPRVESAVWRNLSNGQTGRAWFVTFEDGCGCIELEQFGTWGRALRFAENIARGIDRWNA